jgi:hypothetical protein
MASDEKGLKEGLKKAEEIVEEGMPKSEDSDMDLMDEKDESSEMDMEEECSTPEEVDAKIKELELLKEKMLSKKM